jgi:two-component system, NarL family, response regulator NreC
LTIRILIADDHKIVCDGLKALLEAQPDMEIVAQAENGREAVKLVQKQKPDMVIMDVAMPDLNGLEAVRQILSTHPHIKVIALSMHADRRYVTGMLSAGASGYILKHCAFEELVHAIRVVLSNQVYLSPTIAGIVVQELAQSKSSRPQQSTSSSNQALTPREREVLQLIAEGHSAREIAQRLHLSVKTIETHRRQMMEKLEIRSIADLTKFAIREGLTTLDK